MSAANNVRRVSRRTMVNAMLYVGVLAMGMITYYDDRTRNAPMPARQGLALAQITALNVHRPGYQTIGLARVADGWVLRVPINLPAMNTRVAALLSLTQFDSESGYDANELDLAELGLAKPTASIHFSTDAGSATVLLGGKGPNNVRRYVQIEQRVWLLDDVFLPLLSGGLSAFAQRDLLTKNQQLLHIRTSSGGEIRDREILKRWQSMQAAAIIPLDHLPPGETIDVILVFTDHTEQRLKIMPFDGQLALQPEAGDYAFLLTKTQARLLKLPLLTH